MHKINVHYIIEKNNPVFVFSFQIVELNTDEMVKPAPTCKYKFLVLEEPIILHIKKKHLFSNFLGRKPYDSLSNPYPTSCSRLCNHPVSKEVKKEYNEVLKQTKDTHVNYNLIF